MPRAHIPIPNCLRIFALFTAIALMLGSVLDRPENGAVQAGTVVAAIEAPLPH
jgi:hypothetical protein